MYLIEKLKINFGIIIRNFINGWLYWCICLSFYIFLTDDNHLFENYLSAYEIQNVYLNIAAVSIAISIVITVLDFIFSDRVLRFSPVRVFPFIRILLYLTLALLLVILSVYSPGKLVNINTIDEFIVLIPKLDLPFFRFMSYFLVISYLNYFIKNSLRRLGKSNYFSWAFGSLSKPREEERIFMFVDMKDSTSIAERIGHRKFSHLVQDIFNDLAIVNNYGGEIYQYLGDGAIVSWNMDSGIFRNNCIHAFFVLQKLMERRSRYYQRRYNVSPGFKAGLHTGKVMVLQVGRIKRDISYNGDTINTTARIESMCNEYKKALLISGTLHDLLDKTDKKLKFKLIENTKLKGKKKAVKIFFVAKKEVDE